jgi:ribosomal protein S8
VADTSFPDLPSLRLENLHPTDKMVRTSVLNDALNSMNNAEKAGKRQVLIRPSSKVIIKVLQTMQKHGMFVPSWTSCEYQTKVQVSCRTTTREEDDDIRHDN